MKFITYQDFLAVVKDLVYFRINNNDYHRHTSHLYCPNSLIQVWIDKDADNDIELKKQLKLPEEEGQFEEFNKLVSSIESLYPSFHFNQEEFLSLIEKKQDCYLDKGFYDFDDSASVELNIRTISIQELYPIMKKQFKEYNLSQLNRNK